MEKEQLLLRLGAKIKALRNEKKISQVQLAHLIGKDQQSIQRLEAGKINPSIYYLYEISLGLNISLDLIISDITLADIS